MQLIFGVLILTRDTTTGRKFEESVRVNGEGINLSQNNLFDYIEHIGINWKTISPFLTKKIKPDEAYFNKDTKVFDVYEKKFQQTQGSADEKPWECPRFVYLYNEIGKAIGAEKVNYTYLLSNWFKKPEYEGMLLWIEKTGGNYIFAEETECEPVQSFGFNFGGL